MENGRLHPTPSLRFYNVSANTTDRQLEGSTNMTTGAPRRGIAAAGIAVLLATCAAGTGLCDDSTKIRIGDNDLGGVVKSANGPEAGVWVIAETSDPAH